MQHFTYTVKKGEFMRLKLIILASCFVSTLANSADRLLPGEILQNDARITSPNNRYSLVMQTDGSLVMYRSDGSIRYAMEKYGTYAIMQTDGYFVQYRGTTAIWNSETYYGCTGCELRIFDTGDLAIGRWQDVPVWAYVAWGIGEDPDPPASWNPTRYPLERVSTSVPTYAPTGDTFGSRFTRRY